MKLKSFENVVIKKYNKISTLFDKVNLNFDASDIHTFRIEIKRLIALLSLANAGKDNAPSGIKESLKNFYAHTGTIRGLQLQQERIAQRMSQKTPIHPGKYILSIQNELTQAIRETKKSLRKKKNNKIIRSEVFVLKMKKNGQDEIEEFVRLKHNMLARLLTPFFPADETLHSLRKIFKDLLYTWPYIGGHFSEKMISSILSEKNNIKSICKKLGDFQNICSSLILLQNFNPTNETSKKGKLFLKGIETEWEKNKEVLRAEIAEFFQKRILPHKNIPLLCEENKLQPENVLSEDHWVVQ